MWVDENVLDPNFFKTMKFYLYFSAHETILNEMMIQPSRSRSHQYGLNRKSCQI